MFVACQTFHVSERRMNGGMTGASSNIGCLEALPPCRPITTRTKCPESSVVYCIQEAVYSGVYKGAIYSGVYTRGQYLG